jgi:hypothetical protein
LITEQFEKYWDYSDVNTMNLVYRYSFSENYVHFILKWYNKPISVKKEGELDGRKRFAC